MEGEWGKNAKINYPKTSTTLKIGIWALFDMNLESFTLLLYLESNNEE